MRYRRRRRNVTDRERRRVLDAARELLAKGQLPTIAAMADAVPRLHRQTVERLRREYAASGEIPHCSAPRSEWGGLTGRTAEERREIRRRYRKVRARKIREQERLAALGLNSMPMFPPPDFPSMGTVARLRGLRSGRGRFGDRLPHP